MPGNFARTFSFMLAGPIIWAVHFLFIYSVNGVNCARPGLSGTWMEAPVPVWIIVAASVLALVAMAAAFLFRRSSMPPTAGREFIPWLAAGLSLLSALAVVWETLPVLLVPACT